MYARIPLSFNFIIIRNIPLGPESLLVEIEWPFVDGVKAKSRQSTASLELDGEGVGLPQPFRGRVKRRPRGKA
jgi:hypothetical protein